MDTVAEKSQQDEQEELTLQCYWSSSSQAHGSQEKRSIKSTKRSRLQERLV